MKNKGIGERKYFETFYANRDWSFYRSIILNIIRYSEPGPILDIGAGTGLIVEAAHRWGLECIGTEGSIEAIEIAKMRYPKIQIEHLLFSEKFPFGEGTFQTALLNQVIEHLEVEVAQNVLEETYRVLKPGGTLMIFSPSKRNKKEYQADYTHIHLYSPKELKQLIIETGFVEYISIDYPLNLLGRSKFAQRAMSFSLFEAGWDKVSPSANCIAHKPCSGFNTVAGHPLPRQ